MSAVHDFSDAGRSSSRLAVADATPSISSPLETTASMQFGKGTPSAQKHALRLAPCLRIPSEGSTANLPTVTVDLPFATAEHMRSTSPGDTPASAASVARENQY